MTIIPGRVQLRRLHDRADQQDGRQRDDRQRHDPTRRRTNQHHRPDRRRVQGHRDLPGPPRSTERESATRLNGDSGSLDHRRAVFPSQELSINGTGDATATCTMFVARRVVFTGNSEDRATSSEKLADCGLWAAIQRLIAHGEAGRMMPRCSASALPRDRRGAAIIELALVAPVLALMVVGIVDMSNAFSRKLALEQGAQRAIEKIMQTTEDDYGRGHAQDRGGRARSTARTPTGPARRRPIAASNVTVTFRLECNDADGAVTTQTSTDPTRSMRSSAPNDTDKQSRYIQVAVTDKYTPMFPIHFCGDQRRRNLSPVGDRRDEDAMKLLAAFRNERGAAVDRNGVRPAGPDRHDLDVRPARAGLSRHGRHPAGAGRRRALCDPVPQPDATVAPRRPPRRSRRRSATASMASGRARSRSPTRSTGNVGHRQLLRPDGQLHPADRPAAVARADDQRDAARSACGSPSVFTLSRRFGSLREERRDRLLDLVGLQPLGEMAVFQLHPLEDFARVAAAQQALGSGAAPRPAWPASARDESGPVLRSAAPLGTTMAGQAHVHRLLGPERLRPAAGSARRGGGRRGAAGAANSPPRGPGRDRRTA